MIVYGYYYMYNKSRINFTHPQEYSDDQDLSVLRLLFCFSLPFNRCF